MKSANLKANHILYLAERYPGEISAMSRRMSRYIVNASTQLGEDAIQVILKDLSTQPTPEFSPDQRKEALQIPKGTGLNLKDADVALLFSLSRKARISRASSIFTTAGGYQDTYTKSSDIEHLRQERMANMKVDRMSPILPVVQILYEPFWYLKSYRVFIYGIDPGTYREYESWFFADPTFLRNDEPIKISDKYQFRSGGPVEGSLQRPQISPAEAPMHELAINLCKLAALRFNGSYWYDFP